MVIMIVIMINSEGKNRATSNQFAFLHAVSLTDKTISSDKENSCCRES